jgi:hypothetical protein
MSVYKTRHGRLPVGALSRMRVLLSVPAATRSDAQLNDPPAVGVPARGRLTGLGENDLARANATAKRGTGIHWT